MRRFIRDSQLRAIRRSQAVELGQQEGLLGQRRQTVEQTVQLDQGLHDGAGLFAGDFPLGQAGQGFQVSGSTSLAVVVDLYTGDGGEEGARFVDRAAWRETRTDEGVLGQVGGSAGSRGAPQPAREPVVVVAVEGMQRGRMGEVGLDTWTFRAEGLTNDNSYHFMLWECLPTTAGCRPWQGGFPGRRGTAPGGAMGFAEAPVEMARTGEAAGQQETSWSDCAEYASGSRARARRRSSAAAVRRQAEGDAEHAREWYSESAASSASDPSSSGCSRWLSM